MFSPSATATLHKLLHDSDPATEGLEVAHRLCVRLLVLANEEHVMDSSDALDVAMAAADEGAPDLSAFPGVVRLGTPLRLVGSALSRPEPETYDLLPAEGEQAEEALGVIRDLLHNASIKALAPGNPEGPYLNLYDLCLVRTDDTTPKEVLEDSGVAIGEPLPIAAMGESGHVEFPCVVQILKGGVRLQVHVEGGRLRFFSYHGTEVTDDPAYVDVARAFASLSHPRRGIFDCIHSAQRSGVFLVECVSWDGGTTFRLPLHERLALLDGIEAGPNLQPVAWRVIETPLEMYGLSKKVVVKAMNDALDAQHHGWIIAKPKHVQPGRPAPWALCAGGASSVPHLAEATTAETAFDLLDMAVTSDVPLCVWECHRESEGLQIHQVEGDVRVYNDTYNSANMVDTVEADCYSGKEAEAGSWALNVLREPNGDILGLDLLAEGQSSLHTVPYSARLRLLRNKVAPTLDWPISNEHMAIQGIEALREAIGRLQSDRRLIVRRADSLCEIPMLEVVVSAS